MENLPTDHATKTSTRTGARNDIEKVLSDLATGIKTEPVRQSQFVLPIISIAEDASHVKAKLCTGRVIDVPKSILKNMTNMGTVSNGNERFAVASGEIDVSTDAGKMIARMAHEITRVSRSLQTAHERLLRYQRTNTSKALAPTEETPAVDASENIVPFDTVLPLTVIKLPFTAFAGVPHAIGYAAPAFQYIQKFEVQPLRCFLTQRPRIYEWVTGRPDQILAIEFVLEAAHGTPLGTNYSAQLDLYVTLVQLTT